MTPTKTPRSNSSAPSMYYYILLGLAALWLALQIASLGPLRDTWWGFHLYSFLPGGAVVFSFILLVLAGVLLVRPPAIARRFPSAGRFVESHPIATSIGLAVICATLFWAFRSQHLLLGDALPLKIDLARGNDFHPRQPLTMWLQQTLFRHLGFLFRGEGVGDEEVARRTVALGSVIAGFFFVLTAAALGRCFARQTSQDARAAWLVTLILISQGFMLLFFGYIENYTYYALFIGIYIWLSFLVLEGRAPLVLPGIALVFAIALHLSAAVLLPSFVVLAVWSILKTATRARAVRDLVIITAVTLGLNQLGAVMRDYNLLSALFDVSGRALGGREVANPEYRWSLRHLRDFVNEQFLIGPLGLFLFIPASIVALSRTDRRHISTIFLITLGGSYFLVSVVAGDSNLGYARNWDLLAPGAVCFAAAALFFVMKHTRSSGVTARLLAFALVFSILHLVPWVVINHNEQLSLDRFKRLPLGLGRTEVAVANWYLEHGRQQEAERWFKKALETNPSNATAYAFLGMLLTQKGDFEQAAALYERAVTLRPNKAEYRQNYALTLRELGQLDAALPHFSQLTRIAPDRVLYWRLLNQTLLELGRDDEAVPAQEQLLRFAERELQRNPKNEDAIVESGILLAQLNRGDEAVARFRRLLADNPRSLAGLFNLGSVLLQMGRVDDARPVLERFLQLYPDHPNAAWARQQLER